MNPTLCGRIVRRWTDAGPVTFRSPADEPSPELTVAIVEVFDFVRFRTIGGFATFLIAGANGYVAGTYARDCS